MKPLATSFLLGVAGILVGQALAQGPRTNSSFGEFQGDGYYWYKQDPEEEKPAPPPKAQPVPATPAKPTKEGPKALSAEWMRANMPKLLDAAVDNPTPENVSNYMYAQRVLLDKSQNFSNRVKEVVATDPFLDENNRVPIAQFAQAGFMRDMKTGQTEVMNFLANKAGIWVFVDKPSKCAACDGYVQNVIVGNQAAKGVASQYNFNLRKIDVSTPQGKAAAKKLNLKVTPTTVLVMPPNNFFLVSQGLMSQTQLTERLLIAAKASGTLPKDLDEKVNPFNKGVLSTEEMGGLSASESPSDVMKHMRERIKGEKQ